MSKKRKIDISVTLGFKDTGPRILALTQLTCEYKTKDNKIKTMVITCDTTQQEQWTSTNKLYIDTKAVIPADTFKPWNLNKILRVTEIVLIGHSQQKTIPKCITHLNLTTHSKKLYNKFIRPKYETSRIAASPFNYEIPTKRFGIGVSIQKTKNRYRSEIYYKSKKQVFKNTKIKIIERNNNAEQQSNSNVQDQIR